MLDKHKLIRKPSVLGKTALTHSAMYALMKSGDFPRPLKLGKRSVAWVETEVDAWIEELDRSMGRGDNHEL